MNPGNIIERIDSVIDLIEYDETTLEDVLKELKQLVEDIEESYQGYSDSEFGFDDLD